jgi:hypothetical protein
MDDLHVNGFATSSSTLYDLCGTTTLLLRVRGVELMRGTPSQAHVLHARVEEGGQALSRVRQMVRVLLDGLMKEGLLSQAELNAMKRQQGGNESNKYHSAASTADSDQVDEDADDEKSSSSASSSNNASTKDINIKFHMSLANTRHRKQVDGSSSSSSQPFDAQPILSSSQLKNFDFGLVHIPSVSLVQRYAYENSGFYKTLASAILP